MNRSLLIIFLSASILLISCDKEGGFATPQGGQLPTNYIFIKDSSITPASMRVVKGSSITFVNQTTVQHSFRSYDSTTIQTGMIAPDRSYFFKKDTIGNFPFYCEQHPQVNGVIIIE